MVFFIKSARYSSERDLRRIIDVDPKEICVKLGILITLWRSKNIKKFDNAVTKGKVMEMGDDSFAYDPFKVKSFLFKDDYWQPTGDQYPVKIGDDPTLPAFAILETRRAEKLMKEFLVHYGIFGNCLGFSTKKKEHRFSQLVA